MSPVNSDDSSGDAFGGAGRPLTRKEIRAQEKFQATQGHDVIPPQAFETGRGRSDAGTAAEPGTAPPPTPQPLSGRRRSQAADAPDLPAAAPTVHEEPLHEEPVHEEPVHEEPVHEEPVHEEPVHDEPVHAEPVHDEPVHEEPVHEYARPRRRWPRGRRLCVSEAGPATTPATTPLPTTPASTTATLRTPHDEAHHVYDDSDGQPPD